MAKGIVSTMAMHCQSAFWPSLRASEFISATPHIGRSLPDLVAMSSQNTFLAVIFRNRKVPVDSGKHHQRVSFGSGCSPTLSGNNISAIRFRVHRCAGFPVERLCHTPTMSAGGSGMGGV